MELQDILIEPVITEKSTDTKTRANVYVFKVNLNSSKQQIKNAVEKNFKLKVLGVNCARVKGKLRGSFGRGWGKTSDWKKAYVKVEAGKKIEIFEGS